MLAQYKQSFENMLQEHPLLLTTTSSSVVQHSTKETAVLYLKHKDEQKLSKSIRIQNEFPMETTDNEFRYLT